MQIPSTGFIEAAIDSLKTFSADARNAQRDELNGLGDERARKAGGTALTDDFRAGYQLGLQTARIILAGEPLLALKGINPSDLL